MKNPSLRRVAGLLLALLPHLSACSADAGSTGSIGAGAQVAPADGRLPALHLVRIVEALDAGENVKLRNYRQTTDICRQAGFPVRALTAEQQAKIGTARLELAFDAGHRLDRVTEWDFESPSGSPEQLCQFTFTEEVSEAYLDEIVSAGTADGTWQSQPAEDDELQVFPLDDSQVEEARQIARQSGWKQGGTQTVAGQPCTLQTSADGTVCMWSAGRTWGLSELPEQHDLGLPPSVTQGGLNLEQEPADGTGTRLRTVSFAVGTPLSKADVAPVTRK